MSETTLTSNFPKAKTVINDSDEESAQIESLDWKPSLHEWLILITLSLISMMISVDGSLLSITTLIYDANFKTATILVTSLGVSHSCLTYACSRIFVQ
jgi:hypothetical protein